MADMSGGNLSIVYLIKEITIVIVVKLSRRIKWMSNQSLSTKDDHCWI